MAPGVWAVWDRFPSAGHRSRRPHPADLDAVSGMPTARARESLAARTLLRALLDRWLPGAADLPLVPDPRGRPALAGRADVGISLSHDGGTAAAALSLAGPVGVDVQQPPDEVPDRLARRCLRGRTDEWAALPAPVRGLEFAWVWSVQEACVKAAGTGLSGSPWSIDVPLRPVAGRWRDFTWVALRDHAAIPVSCAFGGSPCSVATPPT